MFSIFPTQGEIAAGKSQDFVVTFSPDHESLYYSDCLKVVLFGKVRQSRYLIMKWNSKYDLRLFLAAWVLVGVSHNCIQWTGFVGRNIIYINLMGVGSDSFGAHWLFSGFKFSVPNS